MSGAVHQSVQLPVEAYWAKHRRRHFVADQAAKPRPSPSNMTSVPGPHSPVRILSSVRPRLRCMVTVWRPIRLPVIRAIVDATSRQYRLSSRDRACRFSCRAASWASGPKSRTSLPASRSSTPVLSCRRRSQDSNDSTASLSADCCTISAILQSKQNPVG